MPKQKGIIQLKGTLDGICYYQLNGKYISRKAVGPSKERINNDPAFKNVKSNNQEFGAASMLSKAIRTGLAANAVNFKDTYMASRLSGLCRKIIQKGRGNLGQREANLHNNPKALIGFQLNKEKPFNQIYTVIPLITYNTSNNRITILIPKSTNNNLIKRPKSATHFQLTAALSIVSNYHWKPIVNAYKPIHPKQNGLGITQQTQPLDANIDHTQLKIQLHIPTTNPINPNTAITVWLGITYLEKQNNQYISFKTGQSMQCIAIC